MIKRLQIKFIAITVGAMLMMLVVIFLTLNIFMQTSSSQQTEMLLELVAEQDGLNLAQEPMSDQGGRPPEPEENPEPRKGASSNRDIRDGRFFYVKVDGEGAALEVNVEMMFEFSAGEAESYAGAVLSGSTVKGAVDNLQYIIAEKPYGKIIVFAERGAEYRLLESLLGVSLWTTAGAALVLVVFSLFLSNWAIRPVRSAFEKQRRFVSDASHELKTPLTIITANTDVLENEIGENQRLTDIKAQTGRMSGLVRDLLTLARSDENPSGRISASFDLSHAVLSTTLEFESRVFEASKTLDYDISPEISCTGDEQQIKRLVSILLDNAVVHSDANGRIELSLSREGGHIALVVFNTGSGIPEDEREKVFDRFYRTDASRSRETGGYGLGLSIAKSIVDAHGGKISVSNGDGVRFTVVI